MKRTSTILPEKQFIWSGLLASALIVLFMFVGCWQKQNHGVTNPEVPHYQIAGTVTELYHPANFIADSWMELVSVTQVYDVTFPSQTVQTDSAGFFRFDSVSPGEYLLRGYWREDLVTERNVQIEYDDKQMEIGFPKPLRTDLQGEVRLTELYEGPFLVTAEGVDIWVAAKHLENWPPDPVIYECSIEFQPAKFILRADNYYPNPRPGASALDVAHELYLTQNDSVTILNHSTGGLISDFILDEELKFSGLTLVENALWTVYGSTLQFRGEDVRSIESSFPTDANNLQFITEVGNFFYAYDSERGLLLLLLEDGSVVDAYRLLEKESGTWVNISDFEYLQYYSELLVVDDLGQIFTAQLP